MNILFDEVTKVFKIDTVSTSYCISVAGEAGFIGHAYWGPKISDTDVAYLTRCNERSGVPTDTSRDRSAFLDAFPMEFPGNQTGDFRESAIEVLDSEGHSAVELRYHTHRIFNGKPRLNGLPATFADPEDCMTLEIEAEDPVLSLTAVLRYSIFRDSDAIARSVSVINHNVKPISLTKIYSASVDMDAEDFQLLTLHGGWAKERRIERRPIAYGKQSVGSLRGETSHQEHPFLAVLRPETTQESGDVYGFNFVYSGNFIAQAEKSQNDSLRLQIGIHSSNFSFELEQEEEFTAPEVILVYSDEGLGKMSRCYHNLFRDHLIRSAYKNKKRPILINNWEATYFNFDTEKLIDIAKDAKKLGIEMLVMDDGWFGKRNDDNSSLGDWTVNEEKLKGGLKCLVDEVNKLGLKFGIWFEPEMVSPDSDLYRAHPDWAIQIPERENTRSRNQYVLDITRPEVEEYVFGQVSAVLRSANIEYVKWDMNRQLTNLGSFGLDPKRQGEISHRFVLALYRLQERLITEFPNLLLENCSGGGGRFDAGMLYYSPQIWCSDDTDAIERLSIQEGTSLIYPLSSMGAHVSDCPNHGTGRTTPFETRGHVALAGTFGYELDITRISEEERNMIPDQTKMYHKYNDLVRTGDYYRYASYRVNGVYDCYAVIAKDRSEALVTYVQVMNRINTASKKIRLKGLDPMKRYELTWEGNAAQTFKKAVFSGDTLIHAGIIVPNMKGDFVSILIHVKEV